MGKEFPTAVWQIYIQFNSISEIIAALTDVVSLARIEKDY